MNLNELAREMIPAKFQNNPMSGSGEEVENVFLYKSAHQIRYVGQHILICTKSDKHLIRY